MSKILVSPQKVFGGSLSASGNIAQFGSLAASSPAYTLDPAVLQALAAYGLGWAAAVVGVKSPPLQDRNALDYLFSRQLAYLQQIGLVEWDPGINFALGAWAQNGSGVCYVSQQADNLNHVLTDTNWWLPLSATIAAAVVPRQTILKAWIVFNGQGSVSIYDSYNVSGIARLGTGDYLISFATPLSYLNYGYNLSLTQENGIDACVIATRFPGDTKTVNQLEVRTVSCVDSSGFDCPEVCVSIFSS